jgi:hypothetical protein
MTDIESERRSLELDADEPATAADTFGYCPSGDDIIVPQGPRGPAVPYVPPALPAPGFEPPEPNPVGTNLPDEFTIPF